MPEKDGFMMTVMKMMDYVVPLVYRTYKALHLLCLSRFGK